jgi:hypothetical protein
MCPNNEEALALESIDPENASLHPVEQVMLAMVEVSCFKDRLHGCELRGHFEERNIEVESAVDICSTAVTQALESEALQTFLAVILAIGNVLNGGTPRGGAYGFDLPSLNKLHTVKSADGKSTLLKYAVEQAGDAGRRLESELSQVAGEVICRNYFNKLF